MTSNLLLIDLIKDTIKRFQEKEHYNNDENEMLLKMQTQPRLELLQITKQKGRNSIEYKEAYF
jgi:hypothetical protein